MSNKKNWRQFNYIKNEQHSRDSQSELSESRTSRSYHFNKVKFNKSRDNIDKSANKFGFANIAKIKDSSRQNSFANDSMIKRVDSSSNIQKIQRPSLPAGIKVPKAKKISMQMQRFLSDIKQVHQSFKNFADNILLQFEKIKAQLETNLLKVIDNLLKSGNNLRHQQKIHHAIHKSFQQMKRNVSILPSSLLSQLNNSRSEEVLSKTELGKHVPGSALLISPDEVMRKQRHKGHTVLKEQSGEFVFELPISSSQKVRPSTERKILTHPSSLNQKLLKKQFIGSPVQSKENGNGKTGFFPMEQPNNLQNIIGQMRSILDQ